MLIALLVAAAITGQELRKAVDAPAQGNEVPVFGTRPLAAPEQIVASMDGQRFAQIAVDPTLSHPDTDFFGNRGETAYRGSRPIFSWMAWVGSAGGRTGVLAWTLIVLSFFSLAVLVWAAGLLATARGRSPLWAWVVVVSPGVLSVLTSPGEGDLLAVGFVLLGLIWWSQPERRDVATVAFVLGGLTRETTLLIPAALLLRDLVTARRLSLRLLWPFGAYAAWVVFVRVRVGVFPSEGGGDNFTLPFVGLRDSIPYWGGAEWLSVALLIGLVLVAWPRLDSIGRLLIALHLALFSVLATYAAGFWWAFGRVLLPAYVIALVELLPRASTTADDEADVTYQPMP